MILFIVLNIMGVLVATYDGEMPYGEFFLDM